MKQIIIGREGNQPFSINDEYVSRQHAIFTYDETTGVMTITDRSRPNVGTFVKMGNQFQQISRCNVCATTEIRLGPYYTFRVGQLFQVSNPTPVPQPKNKSEKVDIAYLRKVAENYESTKLELEQKQANINSLRTLSLVGSVAGGAITSIIPMMFNQKPEWYFYAIGPVLAVGFVCALQFYCSSASKQVIVSKNKNDKNYKITFCCPKCHVPFVGKLYENILAEGKCPKCKSEFYDSKI